MTDVIAKGIGILPGYGNDPRAAYQQAKRVTGLLGFTPAGIPEAGYQAGGLLGTGYQSGSIPEMAAGGILGAISAMPAVRNAAPEVEQAIQKGITAYHGSPYLFDKFDASKIGTGEGAQVYGHGLYFAEHPDTATAYKEALAGKMSNPARNARLSALAKEMDQYSIGGQYRKFNDPRGDAAAAEYDRIMQERADDKGHMYQVQINANPDHFLDWDKPYAQQHPNVQAAIDNLWTAKGGSLAGRTKPPFVASTDDGDAIHAAIAATYGRGGNMDSQAAAAKALQSQGIPGIKYLDQGSRTAGDGTRNYVVFDPKIVDIMKRYALPAAVGAGAATGAVGLYGSDAITQQQY